MASILNNEIEFNGFCHAMAKSNWSLAYNYITDIFQHSVGYKDKCNKVIKASLLTVRGVLLYIPLVNRITQLALRILSPKLTEEFIKSPSCFGKEELEIRYSKKVLLPYFPQGSLNGKGEEDERVLMETFGFFESLEDFQKTLENPNGPFAGLNQEEKQQMMLVFLELRKNLSQEQQGFAYLVNNNPNAFKELLQNPRSVESSEEEQSDFDNWVKEMNLDKDVSVSNTTKIQSDLELD